ncbi:uncharacterized protein LOC142235357 [Haematobia irritans]|uniref:uncharacterized protein LOC142235357 n=1 Tax=Haematobia irritans TaxID=7368 RepID=UPI003F4F8059
MPDNTNKQLKIIEINVNSLIQINRRINLQRFIDTHNPDIVLLNETKLNCKYKLYYEGYSIIRKDRPNSKRAGGTAILIKKSIKHKKFTNNTLNSLKCLETVIVRIPLSHNKFLFVISAYYPSGNNDPHFKNDLNTLFTAINALNTDNLYILAGDLNCKHKEWKNKENNTKGNILYDWVNDSSINLRYTGVLEKDTDDNYLIYDDEDIVNVIGSYFDSVHSRKEIDSEIHNHLRVDRKFNAFLQTKMTFENNRESITTFSNILRSNDLNEDQAGIHFVTPGSLKYIFRNLKNKVSSGIDNIPNIVLRNLPEITILDYCAIFNNLINNSYFPEVWKIARLIVIPKKDKDPTEPSNMRPISLLPNISKIFEICVNITLNKLFEDKGLICDKQFGFKYNHSTINAVTVLTSFINWNWNRKYCTGACQIDMEKAFDNIWIPGLVCKMVDYGLPMQLIILLHNMISDKHFIVNRKGINSKVFNVHNGLQQGTVLAPILFNLYILDLLNTIDNIISFADDIIIYNTGETISEINTELQQSFDVVETYATDWHMKINTDKCESILFRPPVNRCNSNVRKRWRTFGVYSRQNDVAIRVVDTVKTSLNEVPLVDFSAAGGGVVIAMIFSMLLMNSYDVQLIFFHRFVCLLEGTTC